MKVVANFKYRLIPQILKFLTEPTETRDIPEFLEELLLPGQNAKYHNGFVNSAANPKGLRARFYRTTADGIGVLWENNSADLEGYPGIVHGGITAALLDEAMCYAVFQRTKQFGVTLNASFSWQKTLKVGVQVRGYSRAIFVKDNLVNVSGFLVRSDGQTIAKADGLFYLPTLNQFKRIAELSSVPEEVQGFFRESLRKG